MRQIFYPLLILLIVCIAACSRRDTYYTEMLTQADEIMESRPDSALMLLKNVDASQLALDERARYALLMSMALDKNYIDTTTFDVLQPAIDYYPENGTPDEILTTFYYQGRIFQNQGDRYNALNCFFKGLSIADDCNDSLMIARILVAQAYLYYEFYDFDNYSKNHLSAAKIYDEIGYKDHEFDCILNALNGSIISNNKQRADSLISVCNRMKLLDTRYSDQIEGYRLSYLLQFGDKQELRVFLSDCRTDSSFDINSILNLALAYHELGDDKKAKQLLDSVGEELQDFHKLKYHAIMVSVLKELGDYEGALTMYFEFSNQRETINNQKFEITVQSMAQKHALQLKSKDEARQKSIIMWCSIGGLSILLLVIIILLLLARSHKIHKELAYQRAKTAEADNARLKSEHEKLALERDRLSLENQNLQLEKDKKALEADNLLSSIEMLSSDLNTTMRVLQQTKKKLEESDNATDEVRYRLSVSLNARFVELNTISAVMYENTDFKGNLKYEKIAKEVNRLLTDFSSNKTLAELEEGINFYADGWMTQFRRDFPNLNESQYTLVIYLFYGFSTTTIAYILGKNNHVVHQMKYRLKQQIASNLSVDIEALYHRLGMTVTPKIK